MEQLKIIQLTPEELQSAIAETLRTQLEEFYKNFKQVDPDELLTRKETAALLKINLATLWSYSKSGKIVSVGIGNRVFYRRSDIENALIRLS